jgi:hypothetical protein
MGADIKTLMTSTREACKELLGEGRTVTQAAFAEIRKRFGNPPAVKPDVKLEVYSKWLLNYSFDMTAPIEVPGQYSGEMKPDVASHVKVVSFGDTLKCMTSIRRPKRITFNGDNESEYFFLVKVGVLRARALEPPWRRRAFVATCGAVVVSQGGEDLRQDQRIEQLFTVMNSILQQNAPTAQRGLKLGTYAVIPMTRRVGLIEWVVNTRPIKVGRCSAWRSRSRWHVRQWCVCVSAVGCSVDRGRRRRGGLG